MIGALSECGVHVMEITAQGLDAAKIKTRKRPKRKNKVEKEIQLQLEDESNEQRLVEFGEGYISKDRSCGDTSEGDGPPPSGSAGKDTSEVVQVGGLKRRKRCKERNMTEKDDRVNLESEFKKEGKFSSSLKEISSVRQNFVVHVSRPKDVEKSRQNLPIVMMEQEIMEAIFENPVVIVCGETGCGKTTQVPQFLYEAGYGSSHCSERAGIIGVTQPRRVAVLATARRVSQELSVQLGQELGFQVRHDRKIGEKSCIKFMTDGILLRELQADFLLRKYSVLVLDEAHERSLNTDILIGMLSRIIPLRQKLYDRECETRKKVQLEGRHANIGDFNGVRPLKLVIMSATLRVEDFTANSRMFPLPPPVLRVPARQFSVTVHFSKKTELLDYMGAAFKKVRAIHQKLPPGGILVFLTGQREVEDLCRRLRKAFCVSRRAGGGRFPQSAIGSENLSCVDDKECLSVDENFSELNLETLTAAVDGDNFMSKHEKSESGFLCDEEGVSGDELLNGWGESEDESDLEIGDDPCDDEDALQRLRRSVNSLSERPQGQMDPVDLLRDDLSKPSNITDPKVKGLEGNQELENGLSRGLGPLHVLPLYAMLPAAAQLKVFSGVPRGLRLVVVATNVAETSITIPGVRYVVDCGRAKEKEIVRSSGVSRYEVQWISKAAADQRAGRAGRTGPGHCYRLYSSAHFNNSFPQFAVPEINKAKIEGVVLIMKCMGIDKVANFPFPSPPDHLAVVEAERCLRSLSALSLETGLLTPTGQAMAVYPISPRHSRMLLAAIEGAEELHWRTRESQVGLAFAYAVAVAAALSLEDPFLREALTLEEDVVSLGNKSMPKKHPKFTAEEMESGNPDYPGAFDQHQMQLKLEKVERNLRRSKANSAHARFRNASSDAISVANALRAYEQADNPEGFCQFHFLHAKTMHEMSRLRKQLWDLVICNTANAQSKLEIASGNTTTLLWNKDLFSACEDCWCAPFEKSLNTMQEDLIRKAICAGWADQVSRRLSVQEQAAIVEPWKQRKVRAYRACSLEEPVFLHPSSSIAREAPEFVVYNELVNTSRTYMRRVTRVDSVWLARQARAQCVFSKTLVDPPPWYDSIADDVMGWVTPSFGPHLWNLPMHCIPMKKGKHRTAVFASAFLQGKVLPSLGSLYQHLTNDPSILVKPESQALKRASELLCRLGGAVDTRSKLSKVWASDNRFLYSEVLSWVQRNYQGKLNEIWEQLLLESQCSGDELFRKSKA